MNNYRVRANGCDPYLTDTFEAADAHAQGQTTVLTETKVIVDRLIPVDKPRWLPLGYYLGGIWFGGEH
jgi:hypothetical protein